MLSRKSVYPYEYMDEWGKMDETTLPEKEEFYSNVNMEDITDADYMHAERVCKDVGEYHDLYLKRMHYVWLMFSKNVFQLLD